VRVKLPSGTRAEAVYVLPPVLWHERQWQITWVEYWLDSETGDQAPGVIYTFTAGSPVNSYLTSPHQQLPVGILGGWMVGIGMSWISLDTLFDVVGKSVGY